MGGDQKLTGPDLTSGIAEDELRDGAMLVGHANGEGVLLARRGDEVFAIGSTCTHYSGPLGEGLLVGDTVRCPWHHACFSLRTGEVERAPAFNPVACWNVERADGRIVVRSKRESARAQREVESPPSSVVIIGGGAAGHAAAETLRNEGYAGPVTLVSADAALPVDRPNLSKDYLAGNAPEEWIPLRGEDFYREHDITLELGARVTSLDTAARRIQLEDGRTLDFGALLLATGADPVRLPLPGADLPHVHYLRTLADSRAIIAALPSAKQAIVMGASFIGLEVAASLRARGLAVAVVAPETRPLERVMGTALGDFVRALHEEHGVVFHLGRTARSIDSASVTLDDGTSLAADLVVIGVGVRPNVALAEAAGIRCDKGILVDTYLETSAGGVFAAGDVARYADGRTGQLVRIEHWVVAQRQGRVAACNILGRRVAYDAVPFFWSQHYDVPIAYVGHAESWDHIDVSGDISGRDCAVAFRKDGHTLAIASIYRDVTSLEAEAAMERDDEDALHRLVPPGAR